MIFIRNFAARTPNNLIIKMRGKHNGNRNPYTDQRDAELLRAYRRAKKTLLDQKGYVKRDEALDLARSSPCSRYFVSEQRASIVIKKLLAFDKYIKSLEEHNPIEMPEDPLRNMLYMRRRMFSHLFMQYKRLRDTNPDCNHEELVTMACASPAGEFYLTIDSTRAILNFISVNAKNNLGHTSCQKFHEERRGRRKDDE